MLVEKSVHVGNQADFMLKPKLCFGVARNINVGDTFTDCEITSTYTEFDLSNFPNGLQVTLTEQSGGGLYKFEGLHME